MSGHGRFFLLLSLLCLLLFASCSYGNDRSEEGSGTDEGEEERRVKKEKRKRRGWWRVGKGGRGSGGRTLRGGDGLSDEEDEDEAVEETAETEMFVPAAGEEIGVEEGSGVQYEEQTVLILSDEKPETEEDGMRDSPFSLALRRKKKKSSERSGDSLKETPVDSVRHAQERELLSRLVDRITQPQPAGEREGEELVVLGEEEARSLAKSLQQHNITDVYITTELESSGEAVSSQGQGQERKGVETGGVAGSGGGSGGKRKKRKQKKFHFSIIHGDHEHEHPEGGYHKGSLAHMSEEALEELEDEFYDRRSWVILLMIAAIIFLSLFFEHIQ
eukprot:Cvel_10722.t1-p1 / transcript=Cvel_10722.t1 / gene=Cvel_10722 / organism=Chromera_velia_CCMP2878 / gene_product=hypothetical protein / transcript_product=hypothetical protein / location=Cvel_scaffold653:62-1329(-) / protein_length=330 / sequence_SO=supercontig / SO=protein_coding / is_pseudo=false